MSQRSLVDWLPQEIIDHILDTFRIEPANRHSRLRNLNILKSCSLVCRSFTSRCQYHIFSLLEFEGGETRGPSRQQRQRRVGLYHMLLSKPRVASGIRHVSVSINPQGMASMIRKVDAKTPGLLLSLRERQITSIEFCRPRCSRQTHINPQEIQEFFIRPFIQTSFITFLHISDIIICTSLLACFPNLVDLSLSETQFYDPTDARTIVHHRPPSLRSLTISSTRLIKEILRACGSEAYPLFNLSRLRVFKVPLGRKDDDTGKLGQVFNLCAKTIEELYLPGNLSFQDEAEASATIYNLGRFPKLTVLDLSVAFTLDANPNANFKLDPFIPLRRFLATIPTSNTLKKFGLGIHITALESFPRLHFLKTLGWKELDIEIVRICDDEALELNLTIEWIAVEKYNGWTSPIHERSYRPLLDPVRGPLYAALAGATRKKLRRISQSPKIALNVLLYHLKSI